MALSDAFKRAESVAEARRNLGIHDGGEELEHTDAAERSKRQNLPCVVDVYWRRGRLNFGWWRHVTEALL